MGAPVIRVHETEMLICASCLPCCINPKVQCMVCVIQSGMDLRWRIYSLVTTVFISAFCLHGILFLLSFIDVQIKDEILSQIFSVTDCFPSSLDIHVVLLMKCEILGLVFGWCTVVNSAH